VIPRRVDVGGVELAIREWPGSGLPFVLVHGLASNALTWERVASTLASHGHHVVTLDQRGHGQSDKPDRPYDMDTVVTDLDRLLSALGLDGVVLAGQSWGGNVVLEHAWLHPQRLRGVVCVDGGTIDLQATWATWEECWGALAPPPLAGMPRVSAERMLRAAHPGWDNDAIAATFGNFEQLPDGTVRPWLTRDRHREVLRGLWEHRPGTRYPDLRVPVLLVPADDGDPDWTARKKAQVAVAETAIPRVRVQWFHSAHDVHVQQPVELADAMRAALAWFEAGHEGEPAARAAGEPTDDTIGS
jgi:pimeloyl-ACP methyl ester carboxylesterase